MFTKDYIELCKDKRVQELRPKNLYKCNFIEKSSLDISDATFEFFNDFIISIHGVDKNIYHTSCEGAVGETPKKWLKDNYIWLPSGDQLDEEIIKICEKITADYDVSRLIKTKIWLISIAPHYLETEKDFPGYFSDSNPLVAKIKLLLQLLNTNE